MCKLQCTRIHCPYNSQRFPHNDIFRILPSNFRLESVGNPRFAQSLNTLWKRTGEHNVEGELVIASLGGLRLALAGVSKIPGLFEEVALPVWFSTTSRRTGWKVPAFSCVSDSAPRYPKYFSAGPWGLFTYQTRDMPVRWSRMCLEVVSGSARQSTNEPRKWALAASSAVPRKTI